MYIALYGAEPENSSQIPGKVWNAVVGKDKEDRLDRSPGKWRSYYTTTTHHTGTGSNLDQRKIYVYTQRTN